MHQEMVEKYLENYISDFKRNSMEMLKKGKVKLILFYNDSCGMCHIQFEVFLKNFKVNFGKRMGPRAIELKEKIIDKILPIEKDDKWAIDLIKESIEWSESLQDPKLELRYTPAWLDFKTHEIIALGILDEKKLLDILDEKREKERSVKFRDSFSSRTGRDCPKVSCGMKSSFEIKEETEKDTMVDET